MCELNQLGERITLRMPHDTEQEHHAPRQAGDDHHVHDDDSGHRAHSRSRKLDERIRQRAMVAVAVAMAHRDLKRKGRISLVDPERCSENIGRLEETSSRDAAHIEEIIAAVNEYCADGGVIDPQALPKPALPPPADPRTDPRSGKVVNTLLLTRQLVETRVSDPKWLSKPLARWILQRIPFIKLKESELP